MLTDLVSLDATAVRVSVSLVERVTDGDLGLVTPCAEWDLAELLAHLIAQHNGFAAAAQGDGDLARWRVVPLGDDPVAEYRAAAERVLAAFAVDGVLQRSFPLPEFGLSFPGELAVGFHFLDYVVHSWDLARTLGAPVHFAPTVLAVALDIAKTVPGGEARLAAGAPFGPEVPFSGGSRLDEIVSMLGRAPGWPA